MHQRILRGVEGTLGGEDVEEIGLALRVEGGREVNGFLVGGDGFGEQGAVLLLSGVGDQGGLDIAQGGEDGLLVGGGGLGGELVLDGDVGADAGRSCPGRCALRRGGAAAPAL